MPVSKDALSLLEDLKKAKDKEDPSRARDILDRLAEVKGVDSSFIVNAGAGQLVKSLRSHKDKEVKDKAASLTSAYKAVVASELKAKETAKATKMPVIPPKAETSGVPHRHQHHTDSCSRRAGVGRGGCGGAALCFLLSAVMAGGPGGGGCGALIVQTVLGGSMTPIPRPHTFQGGAKRARELSGGGPVKRSQPLSDTGGEEDDEVDMGRGGGGLSSARKGDIKVLPQRVRVLSGKAKIGSSVDEGKSVIYWMSRDQRVQDNWAFLYAQEVAAKSNAPLAVCFNLVDSFNSAGKRQFAWMLKGLKEVEEELKTLDIPMFLLRGEHSSTIPEFARDCSAGLVVVDFCPLRMTREWREKVGESLEGSGISLHEVDAHNVVPVWVASEKQEVGARTLRPKINKLLPKYLTSFPEAGKQIAPWTSKAATPIDWDAALNSLGLDESVPEVTWAAPGTKSGIDNLDRFLLERLKVFGTKRNDPNVEACSDMSPWLKFGQISAARCALEAKARGKSYSESVASFVEELIVRKELSDNFCFYNKKYDSLEGCAQWAQDSLEKHSTDKRTHIYSREQLEAGKTHDQLWNAAQLELVHRGKMHGFMRMYWAKKILEWTDSPKTALSDSIYLNDRYSIDGRDPNGYVGCMWSIGGIHDMGWTERNVFGKIRYMNYDGCKRKFKIDMYVGRIGRMVAALKKR